MASGKNKNLINDQNFSSSDTVEKSGNSNDSSSAAGKNVLSSKQGSQTEFNSYHGIFSSVFQDLHSPSSQNLSYETGLPQSSPLFNVSESSPAQPSPRKSENISTEARESKLFSGQQHGSGLPTGNEDAALHTESGTEFIATPDTHLYRQDLSVQQDSKNEGSHTPTSKLCDNFSKESQQLFSNRHVRCDAILKKESKIELGVTEFGKTPGSDPSVHQFSGSNMNRLKECNTINQPLPRNKLNASQSSDHFYQQAHQSVSNIRQTEHSVPSEVVRGKQRATNQGESCAHLDSSSQLFQNPGCNLKDAQNIIPQNHQKTESDPNLVRKSNYSGKETAEINIIQNSELNQTILNQRIETQDLHSINRKQVKSVTSENRDTQGLNPLPEKPAENPPKRHLPSYFEHQLKRGLYAIPHTESQPSTSNTICPSPGNSRLYSHPGQLSKRGSGTIPLAESRPSTCDTFWPGPDNRQLPQSQSGQQSERGTYTFPLAESQPDIPDTYPLPDSFLQLDSYKERKQFMTSNQRFLKVNPEYVDLRMLQNPYSNRSEHINIFVCGHPHWTNFFLKTLSGDIPVNNTSPYYFVIHRNMIRCGMLVNVFVWKINNLVDSTSFLVSYCLSSRSTIVYVENMSDRPDLANALQKHNVTIEIKRSVVHEMSARLQWLSNFMPNGLGRNVPIVFVWGKYSRGKYNRVSGYSFRKILDLNNTCFRFKSRHNLSAYMECSVDSADEVKEVVFTAIDVAFLGNVGATPIVL